MPVTKHKLYSVNVECDIAAAPEVVFEALTNRTSLWDVYEANVSNTAPGSPISLREGEEIVATEQLLRYDKPHLFARTEIYHAPSGSSFPTQIYFYLTRTSAGTHVHLEQAGYEDMMLCEQEKANWIETLARLKSVCEGGNAPRS